MSSATKRFQAIGYTRAPNGFPLEAFDREVPSPGPDELLVHAVSSSLNPLDYKLAELNFLGRVPPVALGFDFAGTVVARGSAVTKFRLGEPVFGMVPSSRDGVWAAGGAGSYALVPDFMVASKPENVSYVEAGTLGVCFLSAYLGLTGHVEPHDTLYIPGGGGGVGHLAIQKARELGVRTIVSSGGNAQSRSLAKASGADHVFDYRQDDIASEIRRLTDGKGADLVFDATYSEESFIATSGMVRPGGRWVVLGVGPGKTSRSVETESPVASILAAKNSTLINVNLLPYFSQPGALDDTARSLLGGAIEDAAKTASAGTIRPHVGAVINSEVDTINRALADMKAARAPIGKIAVIIDGKIPR